MKDLFGNKKPIQIETEEWWFNGRIIQKQNHPLLSKYISWSDDTESRFVEIHTSMKDAIRYCIENPCRKPERFPKDYLQITQ